jgi:hypothetical protein
VRGTANFEIDLFKDFDVATLGLSNKILSATRSVAASYFTSATLTVGSFSSTLAYI